MRGGALSDQEVQQLGDARLSYPEIGATRDRDLPHGYVALRRHRRLGTGTERFQQAARVVLGWDMHRRAGLGVRPSHEQAVAGSVALLRLGVGILGVSAPVRVVYAVDEPQRRGFAYGTLPGHPERGEESFMVEMSDDGAVTFTITAFSCPATALARLGGPVSRIVQSRVTDRYLRVV